MNPEKECTKCGLVKLVREFGTLRKRNRVYSDSWCRNCRKSYLRKYIKTDRGRSNRRRYVAASLATIRQGAKNRKEERRKKLEGLKKAPCTDCGGTFPPVCMDFDHTQGRKHRGVARMLGYSWARILEEVSKCDLVCANCHRVRTQVRQRRYSRTSRAQKVLVFRVKIDLLKRGSCCDCGGTFSPVAMDFDHVCGEKMYCISQMGEMRWERVLEEIAKCDLVCSVCHRVRTHERRAA